MKFSRSCLAPGTRPVMWHDLELLVAHALEPVLHAVRDEHALVLSELARHRLHVIVEPAAARQHEPDAIRAGVRVEVGPRHRAAPPARSPPPRRSLPGAVLPFPRCWSMSGVSYLNGCSLCSTLTCCAICHLARSLLCHRTYSRAHRSSTLGGGCPIEAKTLVSSPHDRIPRKRRVRFTLAKRILDERWETYPHEASAVGLHEYDGRLPALSAEAIAARIEQLRESAAQLAALDPASLTGRQQFDRELLIAGVDGELFELAEWRAFRRNPMALMGPIEVTSYMDRSYAPPQERAASLVRALGQAPAYLEALAALLEPPFAEPVLRQSIDSYQGVAGFYRDEVAAFVRLHGGASGEEMASVVERAAGAVDALVARLGSHEPAGDFAMGPDLYAKMLRHGEMVELSLADIEAAGERELRRDLDVAASAAKEIVGSGNVAEAMAVIAKRHPTAEGLLDDARAMLEEIRDLHHRSRGGERGLRGPRGGEGDARLHALGVRGDEQSRPLRDSRD